MKKRIITVLVLNVLLFSCTVSRNAPMFKDYGKIENDKCLLYVVRGTSFVGAAVPWSVIVKELNIETGKFEKSFEVNGVLQKSYKPILLKANTFYSIDFGTTTFLFSGTVGSESIFKLKGLKTNTAAIKGNSLIRSNSESGFRFKIEQIIKWAKAVKNAESYTNITEKKSLLDSEFEILVPDNNSLLYNELQTLRLSEDYESKQMKSIED